MSPGTPFSRSRTINLRSKTLEEAVEELFYTFAGPFTLAGIDPEKILDAGPLPQAKDLPNGVAVACLPVPGDWPHLAAVGRCPKGLLDKKDIRLVLLLLLGTEAKGGQEGALWLMRALHDTRRIYPLLRPQTLESFRRTVTEALRDYDGPTRESDPSAVASFLREAFHLAVASRCTSILFFVDALRDWRAHMSYFENMKCIVVSEQEVSVSEENVLALPTLSVSHYSEHRLVQLRSAILLALSRNLLQLNEKVCCIGGLRGSERLDSLLVVSVAEEYQALFNARRGLIPKDVKAEVFERLIAIAHEIALEGREGHPIGAMFIVGNQERLRAHYRSLVLNPFHGYGRQERNLLNPFMDETVKEFASLDGAFIVAGDGVLEAAGVMVDAPDSSSVVLQGGLGTRHTAAAAFTKVHDCLAIVISQSTGQISLFRNGQMFPLTGKTIG
ncbi:MAG: DNA integrity scanning protein DisA nucleotide-binding domain protein [Puniceicoccales bacterium]|jgi:DNA integrity scanning protein DisA with diadenylate cyclase activity|nr:DNA integrity scanning protein DisA nucleotide-binding domain protein [Puniceicoccales bacterium]